MKAIEHVVLAALLHDVGKAFERAEMLDDYRRDPEYLQAYCRKQVNYYSRLHVLHTLKFCELIADKYDFLRPAEGQRIRQADQHWINLASRHHVASTPFEKLISASDHFASAEREDGNYYERRIHQKTYLEPILERVNLDKTTTRTYHRLPLNELSLDKDVIYPKHVNDLPEMEEVENEVWLSRESLRLHYEQLCNAMMGTIKQLPSILGVRESGAVRGLIANLLSLFERFLVQVPSATNIKHPDISLFDHMRITAAIAEGLYRHHEAKGTLDRPTQFEDKEVTKWRLVCGDFSGIQAFIYRLTSKGAAKGLRGRSLYIQLLCDAVSEYLLRELELFPTARIYSSGGKFYLLIADCQVGHLQKCVGQVNKWLLREFGSEVFLGIGMAPVCGNDFAGGNMGNRWKEANEDLLKDRLRRFRSLIEQDADFFEPLTLNEWGMNCQVCGRDDKDANIREVDGRSVCEQCMSLERMGSLLADTGYFFWAWGDDRKTAHARLDKEWRYSFKELGCDLYLLKSQPRFEDADRLQNSYMERLNNMECFDGNIHGYSCDFRFLGKWDRSKESGGWEFDDFAANAKGTKRLGVLRMDVDNLGQLFIRGFNFPSIEGEIRQMGSLSRVATMSRQLNQFFSGYLCKLLTDFSRTQIIYAGGDDLFLIGAWDELPRVAREIQTEFKDYCAMNPSFTISGGISMVRGKYPISRAAELAKDAEDSAKNLKRKFDEKDPKKDALCFFNTPLGWEDYDLAKNMMGTIREIIENTKSRGILWRLKDVIGVVDEYRRLSCKKGLSKEEIDRLVYYQRWRWQLVYNIERMKKRHPECKDKLDGLVHGILVPDAQAGMPVIEWLQLPTRWAELLTRKEEA